MRVREITCLALTLVTVALFWAPVASQAQDFRATISGAVTDPQGAVIPGAKVEIRNLNTNIAIVVTTNESGLYVAPYIPMGVYSVTVSVEGFRSAVRNRVELRIGDRVQIDFRLEVGALTEQVTVTGAAELLETSSASHGQVIDTAKVADMPLFGRNPFLLVALATGAQYIPLRMGTSARPFDNGGMDNITINGGRAFTNEFLLDGVPNTNTETTAPSNLSFVPSPDATAEFKVQTNTYDAQYGRTGGGIINVGLKSGTNQLHGNLYHYFRHDVLNANRWESNLLGRNRDRVRWNQPGVQFDGPAYLPRIYDGRNRTFFMYSWEAIRTTFPWSQTFTVPMLEQREGDFTRTLQANGAPILVYDPATTRGASGTYTRQPFPGNRIPRERMNPIALKSLPYIPKPNSPGTVGNASNLIASPNSFMDQYDQHIVRIDHELNGRHKFFSRYVRGNRHQVMGTAEFPIESSPGYLHWRINQGGNFDLTSVLSPTLVLNTRLGYIRHQFGIAQYGEGFDPTTLGFPAGLVSQLPRKFFPRYSFTEYSNVGPGRSIGSEYTFSDTWSLSETMNKIHGGHSIKFGFEGRVMFNNQDRPTSSFGSFSFTKGFTQRDPIRADAGSGNAFASFLLGIPSGGSIPVNAAPAFSNRYYVLFFQDDWRVSRRLTVNLGLRWDYETPQTERYDRQNRGFDFESPNPFKVPGLQLKGGMLFTDSGTRRPYQRDLDNLQPRFGFALQLRPTTVMRGGYGLTFSPTFDTGAMNGFSIDTPFVGSMDGGITPHNTLNNPYPEGLMAAPGRSQGLATFVGRGFTVGHFGREIPYVQQFSMGFQQELPWKVLIDASLVSTRTAEMQVGRAVNEISAEQLSLGTNLLTLLPNPFAGLLPGTSINGATTTRQQLIRPFPQFLGITVANHPIGKAWYNSLQLKVEKRLSHGLHLLGSYTLSKSLEAIGYLNAQDPIDRLARVLTANDTPHRLIVSGGWELPFFSRGRSLARQVFGGWQVNAIFSVQSGNPIGAPSGAFSSGIDPKLPKGKQTMSHWFNTCTLNVNGVRQNCISPDEPVAFVQQPPYTLRTLSTRFPNIRTVQTPKADVSLFKSFALKEGLHLQFRAEAFNVGNTPWFGGPSTSLGAANFGVVPASQVNDARDVQLSLKLKF